MTKKYSTPQNLPQLSIEFQLFELNRQECDLTDSWPISTGNDRNTSYLFNGKRFINTTSHPK